MFLLPTLVLLLAAPQARALVADHTSIDDRDPLPLPFPATLGAGDLYLGWQDELHWDTSTITMSNGTRVSRSPSDGQNAFTLGFKPLAELSFYAQATFAYRNESFQTHAQYQLHEADAEFPLDVSLGAGLGYSAKGSLLPELQLILGRVFRPGRVKLKGGGTAPGRGFTWAPQFATGMRILGQAFSAAAFDGDPNSPYAGATQRRLVYDAEVLIEAEWKGFVGRFGLGWENLVQTLNQREDTPGAGFNVQNGPMLFVSLGASLNIDNI